MTDDQERWKKTRQRLNEVSGCFCLAKSLQTTLYLHNGRTHSCHHPWTHQISTREIQLRPSALHNTQVKKIARAKMLRGERPSECDYCWKIEDSSERNVSDRILKSAEAWAEPLLDSVADAPWDADFLPTYLEVNFDNVCNMKCSYCSADISSSWMDEIKKFGPYEDLEWMEPSRLARDGRLPWQGNPEDNPYIQAFWKWWPELYPNLKVFRVTGGEPLLSENTFRALDFVQKNPRADLQIAVNSNLMVPRARIDRLVEQLTSIVDKVESVHLYTSIDTWGARAEYIRHGLRHDYFWANVERLLTQLPGLRLVFMCTYNALSVTGFQPLLEHVLHLKKSFPHSALDISYLRDPGFQGVKVLTPDYLPLVASSVDFMSAHASHDQFSDTEIEKMRRLYHWMEKPETDWTNLFERRKRFYRFFQEHDRRRGTKFLSVFPEMAEFWEFCRKHSDTPAEISP